jgi:L-threonylcarbamoyladenylate synthase
VAFPTETVYGLGANAMDPAAVQRIYAAKQRPANNPLIVHISSVLQMTEIAVDIPDAAQRLVANHWPGPLTLVLKRHPQVPPEVSLGRDTVALRMPAHPVARALIAAAGLPVAAPSANRFSRPSATTAQHVLEDLAGRVDIILDAGPTPIGVESTVVDLTQSPPLLLRHGSVPLDALHKVLPDLLTPPAMIPLDDASARPASPGMLSKHYSPQAEVLLFAGAAEAVRDAMRKAVLDQLVAGRRVGVLALDDDAGYFATLGVQVVTLGPEDDLSQVAHNLFAGLRALDAAGVDVLLVRQVDPDGLGAALNDRMLRAAEGRLITV